MNLKPKYKISAWNKGYRWYSVYVKTWYWPFWIKLSDETYNMFSTIEEAEEALRAGRIHDGVTPKDEKFIEL